MKIEFELFQYVLLRSRTGVDEEFIPGNATADK